MMMSHESPQARYEQLYEAFKIFDADNSGSITADELRRVMFNLGEKISSEDLDEILQTFDKDGDGHINREEFVLGAHHAEPPTIMRATPRLNTCFSRA